MPTIINSAEIACSPERLYDYLGQPWRWHEWHPNSAGAQADTDTLSVGDTFREQFEVKPLPFLPFRIRREFHYTVVAEEANRYRELSATGKGVAIQFRYHFEPANASVKFTRILDYQLSGPMRLLAPLLHRRNTRMSDLAMANLKQRMDPASSAG